MSPRERIHISDSLSLPADAVTQKFAFLARSGAGKTYAAGKLAEGMLDLGAQVVVLDPVGVWWGLRLAADGKGKGYPIPVFGGLHGDIPLEPTAGALIADLVVERSLSVVLDVSMFRKGDRKRFATDFAEQLFHQKKAQRSPVHLFVEEAQAFVPQRTQKGEERMLGAFEDIIKLGRNFGVGCTLISQRPQSVNKDVLNQTEALFVLQTGGSQERKALSEWIVEKGLDAKGLVDELPSLPIGTAYLWSPSWLKKLEKVHIAKKLTFNASATPEVGGKHVEPKPLEPVDLEQVRQAMASTIQRAEADDPKALKRRVAELQAQLAKAKAEQPKPIDRIVPTPVLDEKLADRLAGLMTSMEAITRELRGLGEGMAEDLAAARSSMAPGVAQRRIDALAKGHRPATAPRPPRATAVTTEAGGKLPRGARDMLTALASTLRPSLTKTQVAMLAGLKVTGGTFTKYLSILRTAGHVEADRDGNMAITSSGVAAIGGRPPAPSSTQELVELWKTRLPGAAKDMLDALVAAHPKGVTREDLGAHLGLEVRGGTFTKYLSILRSNGLVENDGGELVASDSLFLSEAA